MARPGTTRALYESFSMLSASWPRDALRPELSFGQTMLAAVERALTHQTPTSPPPPQTSSSQGVTTRLSSRGLDHNEDMTDAERLHAEAALRSIQAIKEGKASQEYPVPENVLRPRSNPAYYTRLHDILDKASRGERVGLTFRQRARLFFGMGIA